MRRTSASILRVNQQMLLGSQLSAPARACEARLPDIRSAWHSVHKHQNLPAFVFSSSAFALRSSCGFVTVALLPSNAPLELNDSANVDSRKQLPRLQCLESTKFHVFTREADTMRGWCLRLLGGLDGGFPIQSRQRLGKVRMRLARKAWNRTETEKHSRDSCFMGCHWQDLDLQPHLTRAASK